VSTNYGSLAIENTGEFNQTGLIEHDFTPQLQVIVNAHYNVSTKSPHPRVMEITGNITISF